MPVMHHQFLERNRLISGLAKAVIIVEAPFKSGAINTARHALRQKRKVFVVPWSQDYAKGAGGNKLFIYGVTALVDFNQVLNYLNPNKYQLSIDELINTKSSISDFTLENDEFEFEETEVPDEYSAYFAYIKENSPVSLQEIINFFNKKCVADITADLTLMELDGYIKLINDKYCIK